MADVFEFAKSVGGVGAILIFVLFGAYLIFKPLIDDWRGLVRDLVKDQKEARELFAREMKEKRELFAHELLEMREEWSTCQLAQQKELASVSSSLQRLNDSIQDVLHGGHDEHGEPRRGKSGVRPRPA